VFTSTTATIAITTASVFTVAVVNYSVANPFSALSQAVVAQTVFNSALAMGIY